MRFLVGLIVGSLSACSSVPKPENSTLVRPKRPVTRHQFAPTHIVGRPIPTLHKGERKAMPDPLTGLSSAALYELAEAAKNEGHWRKSLIIWNRLLAEYPHAVQRVYALLGSALCLQRLGRCGEALPRYEESVDLLDPEQDAEDYVDARFAMGACYAKTRNYDEVVDLFSALLENFAMPTEMAIASHISLGVGLFMNGETKPARAAFEQGLGLHNLKKQSEFLDDKYYIGQAHFYLGELHRGEFRLIDLAAGGDSLEMARLLNVKCDHLLDAQTRYVRAIRAGHFGWASASAHQVGGMYQYLYAHMQQLPRPADLTELQGLEYKRELTKKVAVLLKKAMRTWTSALEFAQRTGVDNIWVRETKKKLAAVESLYFNEYLDPKIDEKLDEASDREALKEQQAAAASAD